MRLTAVISLQACSCTVRHEANLGPLTEIYCMNLLTRHAVEIVM